MTRPTNEQQAAADRRGKRARRRQRAAETRIHPTFGEHQRRRLHEMAIEAEISDSQLVRNLVDEALIARSRKQCSPSSWSKSPSESMPSESASSMPLRIPWKVPSLADIVSAQAAIASLVASSGIEASTPRPRRRRRKRWCCTFYR
jgi:hypothetical protein